MNSSNASVQVYIKFGEIITPLIHFGPNITMSMINYYVYNWFNNCLPRFFHIEFYSNKIKKNISLDDNVLNSDLNPFKVNSTPFSHITNDNLHLYIVDDSSLADFNNLQCELSMPLCQPDDDLLNRLISIPDHLLKIDVFNSPLTNTNGSIDSSNNKLIDEFDNDFSLQSFAAYLSDENIKIPEHTNNSHIDFQDFPTLLNESQFITKVTNANLHDSNRIRFSRDVQSNQKHHYLSNKYNTDSGADERGGISYIQGVKSEDEIKKKIKVLPRIRIPPQYHNEDNIHILLFAVIEEQDEGMRVWFKNRHKGFLLHSQLKHHAEFSNPIELSFHRNRLTSNGDYELEIYLLTKRDKVCNEKEEIYRLHETIVNQIHKANHIVSSQRTHIKPTRLLAVLRNGTNQLDWNTCGLSDFIQPRCKHISSTLIDNMPPVLSTNTNLTIIQLPTSLQQPIQNSQSLFIRMN